MSFFKKKVAKLHHRAGGAALITARGVLSGREQNDDGDGRSVFHPRVETA
jgi:hypothetical protein